MVWTRRGIGVGLIVMLVLGVGCAHGRSLKYGDEHLQEGNYAEALRSYRDAQIARPGSEEAAARAQRAERLLVDDAINALDRALQGELRVEAAFARCDEVLGLVLTPEVRESLVTRFEAVVLTLVERSRVSQRFANALAILDLANVMVDQHPGAFGKGHGVFTHRVEILESEWSEILADQTRIAASGGRLASAALFGAMAQSLGGAPVAVGDPRAFALEVRREFGWSLVAEGVNRGRVVGVEDALRAREPYAALAFGVDERVYQHEVRFRLEGREPRLERWDESEQRSEEYQSGTREVENPDYAAQRDRVISAEERVIKLERDLAREEHELQKNRRAYRLEEREGSPSSYTLWNIERGEERVSELRDRLIDARYEVESRYLALQRIPPTVLEPVFSIHSYEIIAQWAELAGSYQVGLDASSVAFEFVEDVHVVERDVSYRHAAQPEIELRRRTDPIPRAEDLHQRFEASLVDRGGAQVLEGFERYRRSYLAGPSSPGDRIEAIATYMLLSPQRVDAALSRELAELSGVPAPEGVLMRLVASPGARVAHR